MWWLGRKENWLYTYKKDPYPFRATNKFSLLLILLVTDLVCLVDLARPQHEAAALHPPGPDSGLGL